MAHRIHRRTFLRWSAGAAAALPLLCCADPDAAAFAPRPEDPTRFPLGVHAGAMGPDGARLWTQASTAAPLVLRVWPDAAPADAPPALEVDLIPGDGGFAAPRVTGLPAGEWWRYGFYDDAAGVRSAHGRFRTAFGPGQTGPLRVGATACTSYGRRPFYALERIAAAQCDVFCHLGDLTYNDDALDQAGYRARYARTLATPGFRAALGQSGSYFTWDDHEFLDNADLYGPTVDVARVAVAKAAYFEHLAVEARTVPGVGALGGDRVMWGSYPWGDAAEFFVLDSRLERHLSPDPDEARYLSEAQHAWLTQALIDSRAHFKIILNSVPIAALPPVWGDGDRWTAFPRQRSALLDAVTDAQVRNLWFLSGDFHVGAAWRVAAEGPQSAYWEILCGPGASAPSQRLELASRSEALNAAFFPPGRIDFASGEHAATVLTFDPAADAVRVQFDRASDGAPLYDAVLRGEPVG